LLGGLTLSLGYPIADLTATIPFTTSAGLEHHTMRRHRNKVLSIKSARNSKGSAYEYHTVNSRVCQRRVCQTVNQT
jgi:hypothetical protein